MGKKYGTRKEVFDGLSEMTRGGLSKDDLVEGKNGKILSKKKSEMAKQSYAKYGFKKRNEESTDAPGPKKRRRKKKNAIA